MKKLPRSYFYIAIRNIGLFVLLVVCSSWLTVFLLDRLNDSKLDYQQVPARLAGTDAAGQGEFVSSKANSAAFRSDDNESVAIAVYRETNESVVNITAETTQIVFNWFFQPFPQKNESTGSGSIIDPLGYVLTNSHVVNSADRLIITMFDGEKYNAKVSGIDYQTDLAVLKFDPGQRALKTIDFGDSENLQVGQTVFAIGNPYGLERTLTKGIISGIGRPIENDSGVVIRNMIQTDASINPGNSGGPLLNTSSNMIGVNSSIYTPSGGSVGIGFALPVNSARRVINELIRYGKVRRGSIDAKVIPLSRQLVRYADLPVNSGLLISEVENGGNAERAGLRGGDRQRSVRSGNQIFYLGGDIIIAVNGVPVGSIADLNGLLENSKPGDKATVVYLRAGRKKSLDLVLSEAS